MTVTRMSGSLILLILLIVGACSGGSKSVTPDIPEQNNRFLDGYIMDSDDKPLTGKPVFVTDLKYNLLDETITDHNGFFRFKLDPSKEYLIFTRSASNNPDGGWKYSIINDDYALPGNPGDHGVIHPETGYRIWMPEGRAVAISPPDEYEIDLGIVQPLCFTLRGTNSMTKILPSTDLYSLETFIRLKGPRGGSEAFQVIPKLFASVNSLNDIQVTATDLKKGNDLILKDNISLYKIHYVDIHDPSDHGGATGFWPDALVPLTRAFDVSADFPSPIWINVDIPVNAPAGVYNGQIRFETDGYGNAVISYSLEVWDITLPDKFYMKAYFGINTEDIANEHGMSSDPGLNTEVGRNVARIYTDFLADRHISTYGTNVLRPDVWLKPDNRSYHFDFTRVENDIAKYLDNYDLPTFDFPLSFCDLIGNGMIARGESPFSDDYVARLINYIETTSEYFAMRGYLDRAVLFVIDEPDSESDYELVRQMSHYLNMASPRPAFMVTEQPAPQNPEWGSLVDHVDIFTPSIRSFYYMGSEQAARTGGENKEEWIYTNTNVYPFPSYSIDKIGIEPRIFGWFAYQRDFQGILYYSATKWAGLNVWEYPMAFGPGHGNGNGYLVYPGQYAYEYTGQDNVNGPVTSIRLENIMHGLQDAQLMYMLGEGTPVQSADSLIPGWFSFSRDPNELLRIRSEIANLIMGN